MKVLLRTTNFMETYFQRPLTEIRKVEKFLGISPFYSEDHFYFPEGSKFPCFRKNSETEPRCMMEDKGRKHPVLKNETYDHLRKYFKWKKFSTMVSVPQLLFQ